MNQEILRMIDDLSASERVLWMSMDGFVPRHLQLAFERSCYREGADEQMVQVRRPVVSGDEERLRR